MPDELGAWHLSVLGADVFHSAGQRGLGARVALLDTGVEVEHPRFADANLRRVGRGTGGVVVLHVEVGDAPDVTEP